MRSKLIFILQLIIISALRPFSAFAQQEEWLTDARSIAMAGAGQVEPAALGNPASWSSNEFIANVYGSRFGSLSGVDHRAVFIQDGRYPLKWGVGASRFGDMKYNRQAISGLLAHRIDKSTVGARIDWNQFRSDTRVSRVLIVTLGGVTQIHHGLRVGAFVDNPGFARMGDQSMPVRMSAGIAIQPSPGCTLHTLVKKDLSRPPSWHGALEFRVRQNVLFRTGFRYRPMILSVGVGFRYWKVDADYALQYNRVTGASIHATARYRLLSPKK